jgi:hypothetical protein
MNVTRRRIFAIVIGMMKMATTMEQGRNIPGCKSIAASDKEQKAIFKGLHILSFIIPPVIPYFEFCKVDGHLFRQRCMSNFFGGIC